MRVASTAAIWLAVLAVASLSACTPPKPGQSETLSAMGISPHSFAALSVCDQVRLYADFGSHFLDLDHMVALVPAWMNDGIAAHSKDAIAQCIADEGLYRLRLLDGRLASDEDVSLAVEALVFKAFELKLLEYSEMQALVDSAVCKHSLRYASSLVLTAYYGTYKKPPPYTGASNEIQRMRVDLCGQ